MIDMAQTKAKPGPVAPMCPSGLAASVQEEVSKQVAIQLAAMEVAKGGGAVGGNISMQQELRRERTMILTGRAFKSS